MLLRKGGLVAATFLLMLIAQGCETPRAVAHDVSNVSTGFVQKVKQTDAWMTENMW